MTEMVQPLRKLMDMKKYKGSKKLTWTEESVEAFHFCRVAVSNCQELYFLEDTATPILQTDASDYGIGGYLYMIVDHQVRVIRFFSKSLVGSQLNWSAREKECYGIYYGVKLFEDLLDNRYFILKTDHMNLTYINVTFTGKVLRWKMYLQGKGFNLYTTSLEKKNINSFQMPYRGYVLITYLRLLLWQTNPSSPFVLLWTYPKTSMID